ncbi:MAG TPA: hypothetical protein VE570_12640 [Thermoleophilaceae bacterium]|nr:hypothetical protein [Thermoleophilaceae bacterium]
MNRSQIDRLVAGVPAGTDARHRRRVDGYAAAARRCDERLAALRIELERAWSAVDGAAASDGEAAAADEVLRLARELDALERIQPRVDSWLRVAVSAVSDDPGPEPFGEGPA